MYDNSIINTAVVVFFFFFLRTPIIRNMRTRISCVHIMKNTKIGILKRKRKEQMQSAYYNVSFINMTFFDHFDHFMVPPFSKFP